MIEREFSASYPQVIPKPIGLDFRNPERIFYALAVHQQSASIAMPDESGKLSEDEKKKVVDWLTGIGNSPTVTPNCPMCGSPEWTIGDHLVMPITVGKGGGVLIGGAGYPQVMVVSSKCGYTRFVNAVVMGLMVSPPQEKKE